jgi:hypothetical protein
MDVITSVISVTAQLPYPATLYVATLPSGGRMAVQATASFGDVLIIFLLVMLVAVEIASMVQRWKHS